MKIDKTNPTKNDRVRKARQRLGNLLRISPIFRALPRSTLALQVGLLSFLVLVVLAAVMLLPPFADFFQSYADRIWHLIGKGK